MIDLKSKKILITGGAQGLGRELVLRLLESGAQVWVIDRDEQKLSELKSLVPTATNSFFEVVDILSVEQLQALRSRVTDRWHRIDILVNNAGIMKGGEFLKNSLADHRQILEVNLIGLVSMTHLFLPDLMDREDSALLQIGSVTGLMGLAFGSTYASSKWGVLGFSESLRQELRALKVKGPHICVVCPSYIETGMFAGAKAPKLMPFLSPHALSQKIVKALKAKKSLVREPMLVKTVPLLRAALPLALQDRLLDWFGVAAGMKHWRGRSF